MKCLPLFLIAGLLALPATGRSQGFSSSALGPPMKDQRHKASDFVPGDKRPSRLSVLEIPLHSKTENDAQNLQGAFVLVRGELLIWSYSFQYWGTAANGGRVSLQTGQTLTFVQMIGNNYQFFSPGVGTFVVVPPPNISMSQILNFAILPLRACNKAIVLNRLGEPTSQTADAKTGETKFVYSSGSFKREWTEQDEIRTHDDGYIPGVGQGPIRTFTTTVPRRESEVYTPYSFEVYFDANDRVTRVNDKVQ